jgi:hypothetical protein
LKLYFATARVVGSLVSENPRSPDWETARRKFWALYWSELSMVESELVERAMKDFGDKLRELEKAPELTPLTTARDPVGDAFVEPLREPAYKLAHAIRVAIEDAWLWDSASSKK